MNLGCRLRGHKWQVAEFVTAFASGQRDHVHIECSRCHLGTAAVIFEDEGCLARD